LGNNNCITSSGFANIYRAQTKRIKRVAGNKFWVKRKRDIYSWDGGCQLLASIDWGG
jgi:hypothetical protein